MNKSDDYDEGKMHLSVEFRVHSLALVDWLFWNSIGPNPGQPEDRVCLLYCCFTSTVNI